MPFYFVYVADPATCQALNSVLGTFFCIFVVFRPLVLYYYLINFEYYGFEFILQKLHSTSL